MKSKLIHFDDGEVQADLTIVKATYAIDLDHAALVGEALRAKAKPADARARYESNAQTFVLPALLAGTTQADIKRQGEDGKKPPKWKPIAWPITFEVLTTLPGDLVEEWVSSIYELNPRWDPFRVETPAEREKKAPISMDA
jgi:hypothetical protein